MIYPKDVCQYGFVLGYPIPFLVYLVIGFLAVLSALAEDGEQPFDIPSGVAIDSIKLVAYQAGVDIVFDPRVANAVQTSAVQGSFTPLQALQLLLEKTPLVVIQDEEATAFAVRREDGLSSDSNDPGELVLKPTTNDQTESDMNSIREDKLSDSQPAKLSEVRTKNSPWLRTLATVLSLGIAGDLNAQSESNDVFDLDPFEVEVTGEQSVRATQSVSATRFATNIDELPFAVNVITEQVIEDLAVTDVKDIVQFAGNVVAGEGTQAFGTTTNNGFRLRGFPTNQNLINGFSVGTGFAIAPNSIQRIEVVKGPASLLYGAIPPGGIINFITKKPQAEQGGYVRYTTGTWSYNRIDAESTGPINDNIRYLVNISQEDRDFLWEGQTREGLNILAAVEMDFAEKKGNILAEYTHSYVDQSAVQAGTPRKFGTAFGPNGRLADELDQDYPVPNFNIRDGGAPQWNETDSLYLKFRYWFNDNYTLRAAYRTQESDNERINQAIGSLPFFIDERPGNTSPQPSDPLYGLSGTPQWDHQGGWGHADNLQVNLLMSYDLGWGTFQFMPGIDLNEQDGWFWRFRSGTVGDDGRRNGNFRSQRKDIFNPDTWVFDAPASATYLVDDPRTAEYEGPGLLRNNTGNDGSSDDLYIYGSGNFLNDNLIVTLGYRESSFENSLSTTEEKRVPTADEINLEDPLTGDDSIYQYGAVYKLIPEKLHVYGNFAQSFQPQLRTIQLIDSDLNPIDVDLDGDGINESPLLNDNPRIPAQHLFGEGWEMGLKGSLGGKGFLTYSAAYFTTTNNNIIRNITVGPNPSAYSIWFPNLDAATVAAIAALDPTERLDEFQVQSGEEEASGVELELTITPFEGWDIRTTFTNLETELLADASSPQAIGRRLPNAPEYMFNIFTRYAFSGALDGFFIGGSADYLSERFSNAPQAGTAGVRARGRTLFNAFAGYRIQSGNLRYRFQLNIQNATDEFVLQGNHLGAFYPPRHYRFSAGIDF